MFKGKYSMNGEKKKGKFSNVRSRVAEKKDISKAFVAD